MDRVEYGQSTHPQTTLDKKSTTELAETFGFVCLSIETFQFGLHVFMCEGHASVNQGTDLDKILSE